MFTLLNLAVGAPPVLLLALGLVPSRWANRRPRAMCRLVVTTGALSLGLLLVAALAVAAAGPLTTPVLVIAAAPLLRIDLWFDQLATIMALLIGFLGLVVALYSVRYLDGEPTQGRFLRWLSFTLGAVLLLVVSGNLLMFTAAWLLTSYGLHQLLTHYADRPAALLAARKKFIISRLGDGLLLAGLALSYQFCGSLAYADLFAAAESWRATEGGQQLSAQLAGVSFVLGAMTKSAQFPLHSWLPDTMETPTPVSALMHAGVINAGGFLILRLSPLVSLSAVALDLLVLVGAVTALFGALVMLTQTSIKRSLAYSTVAQMGFMMLQCGAGAFAAALLHIVAHSLYKAYAFLNSGSAVQDRGAAGGAQPVLATSRRNLVWLALSLAVALPLCWLWPALLGVDLRSKAGGPLLVIILTIAVVQLLWSALRTANLRVALRGLLAAVAVCTVYPLAMRLLDTALADSVARQSLARSPLDWAVWGLVASGFLAMFALQLAATQVVCYPALQALWVHAANGFYVDIFGQRLVSRLWRTQPHYPRPAAVSNG